MINMVILPEFTITITILNKSYVLELDKLIEKFKWKNKVI